MSGPATPGQSPVSQQRAGSMDVLNRSSAPYLAKPPKTPSSHSTSYSPTRKTRMNRYGLMAQQHWARWLPARYATIKNPDSFFSDLGNQASDQIDQLALQLAGDDQPGEGYLVKAGRLGQARRQAEEIVL